MRDGLKKWCSKGTSILKRRMSYSPRGPKCRNLNRAKNNLLDLSVLARCSLVTPGSGLLGSGWLNISNDALASSYRHAIFAVSDGCVSAEYLQDSENLPSRLLHFVRVVIVSIEASDVLDPGQCHFHHLSPVHIKHGVQRLLGVRQQGRISFERGFIQEPFGVLPGQGKDANGRR